MINSEITIPIVVINPNLEMGKTLEKQKIDDIISCYQVVAGIMPSDAQFIYKKTPTMNKIFNTCFFINIFSIIFIYLI